jgi:hypothetical protein
MVGAAFRERELPWRACPALSGMALLRVPLGMHEHLAGQTQKKPQNNRRKNLILPEAIRGLFLPDLKLKKEMLA